MIMFFSPQRCFWLSSAGQTDFPHIISHPISALVTSLFLTKTPPTHTHPPFPSLAPTPTSFHIQHSLSPNPDQLVTAWQGCGISRDFSSIYWTRRVFFPSTTCSFIHYIQVLPVLRSCFERRLWLLHQHLFCHLFPALSSGPPSTSPDVERFDSLLQKWSDATPRNPFSEQFFKEPFSKWDFWMWRCFQKVDNVKVLK